MRNASNTSERKHGRREIKQDGEPESRREQWSQTEIDRESPPEMAAAALVNMRQALLQEPDAPVQARDLPLQIQRLQRAGRLREDLRARRVRLTYGAGDRSEGSEKGCA